MKLLAGGRPNYFYTSDGTRIYHAINFNPQEKSDKPLIVFNYGLICNHNHYAPQLKYFERLNYPILIHDYRGHYSSAGRNEINNITFTKLVDDLFELLNHYNQSNVIMIGHSMGVNITLEFAKRYPHLISKMVLISGTVIPPADIMFDTNVMDLAFPLIKKIATIGPQFFNSLWKEAFQNRLIRTLIKHSGFNSTQISDEVIQIYLKKIGELPPQLFFQLLDEMRRHDIITYLPHIKTDALIIVGDEDKVIPLIRQRILSDHLPNSTLKIIKKGSHVPQLDFPDLINKHILSFMS